MDTRSEIREFLTSRRARITPEQVGLPAYGSRRVPGLRREEVAVLAGVSVPYYTRLERGDMSGVSESVLEALARALQLDEAERAHLFDLARAAATAGAAAPAPARQRVRPSVQHILDAMTGAAAFAAQRPPGRPRRQPARLRALLGDVHQGRPPGEHRPLRLPRPRARDFYLDWDRAASDAVAVLRSAAGRDPHDRDLSDLVGELSTQSEAFRTHWAAHNVRFHINGVKHFHHPVVGELSLNFERLELGADTGLTIFTYTAEPGSRDEEALELLGSWAATLEAGTRPRATATTEA